MPGTWLNDMLNGILNGTIDVLHTAKYISTGGTQPLHEASYKAGVWLNWNAEATCKPREYLLPQNEEDLCAMVRRLSSLRLVGAGHSFNQAPCSDTAMVSLDAYDNILEVDTHKSTVRVQAGIRLRTLGKLLLQQGLAVPCLGSTDAQSLAGVLSTDVHGTGRDHGFLSEQVLSLRLVDGEGYVQTHPIDSPVCQAALGGLGLQGVISEVVLQCVPAYHLGKEVRLVDRLALDETLKEVRKTHEHVSLYYLGGTTDAPVRMNLWRRTDAPASENRAGYRSKLELLDMFYSGFVMIGSNRIGLIDQTTRMSQELFSRLVDGVTEVFPWNQGFPRKLYFRHDEIEYGLPDDESVWKPCVRKVEDILRAHRHASIIEVRFTPNRSRALLGPGVGRATAYVELSSSLASSTTEVFALCEKVFLEAGGQPHLGKKLGIDKTHMEQIFGDRYRRFQTLRAQQDKTGKFVNAFCAKLFA